MVDAFTGPAGLIIVGIMLMGVLNALVVMSSWRISELEVHDLRVEAHRLRLQVKNDSAERLLADRRRRRNSRGTSVDERTESSELHTDDGEIYVAEAA